MRKLKEAKKNLAHEQVYYGGRLLGTCTEVVLGAGRLTCPCGTVNICVPVLQEHIHIHFACVLPSLKVFCGSVCSSGSVPYYIVLSSVSCFSVVLGVQESIWHALVRRQ